VITPQFTPISADFERRQLDRDARRKHSAESATICGLSRRGNRCVRDVQEHRLHPVTGGMSNCGVPAQST
jgi:hypothetical protein